MPSSSVDWTVAATVAPGPALIRLALPPGWTTLRTSAGDVDDQVAALVRRHLPDGMNPELRAELGDEWRRLARVSAAAGAVLLSFGNAVDPDTGLIVSASLLLAPQRWYTADPGADLLAGPVDTFDVPAGQLVRRLSLVRTPSPLGDVAELVVTYTARPSWGEPWCLVVRTCALRQMRELVTVFDAIAASLEVDPVPDVEREDIPAFG
jgi:hypothetical protein